MPIRSRRVSPSATCGASTTNAFVPGRVSVIVGFTHRLRPGLVALAISASLAACASVGSASGSAGETAQVTEPSATAVASGRESPVPSATKDTRPLQGLLPSDFGGAEAHTFAVGQDMLSQLADELSVAPAELEVAFASDHGTAFVQMYALRSAGHEADELMAALPAAAYPGAPPGSVTVSQERLAGRTVTVISDPAEAARIGTFYCLADGEVLLVAQVLDEAVAEAAFEELPEAPGPDY
jgi:hypothetical protein